MSLNISGNNPLSYLGINQSKPIPIIVSTIDPTVDFFTPELGTVWLNRTNEKLYMLVNKEEHVATWKEFAADVLGLETLTGDNPEAVNPDNGNINIKGEGIITVNGDDSTHTLTISVSGNVATQYDADTGSAVPDAKTWNIVGGSNVSTAGAGSIVTINLNDTTNHAVQVGNASGSLTSLGVGATGKVLTGATGANPAWQDIGTNSGLTQHSLVLANGNSAFSALGAATNGQIPIGRTGNSPVLNTITAGSNITVTNGPGTITISAPTVPAYEEGSWVPNFAFVNQVTPITFTFPPRGYYIRVGNMVTISMLIVIKNKGTSSNQSSAGRITNLPFTSGGIQSYIPGGGAGITSLYENTQGAIALSILNTTATVVWPSKPDTPIPFSAFQVFSQPGQGNYSNQLNISGCYPIT